MHVRWIGHMLCFSGINLVALVSMLTPSSLLPCPAWRDPLMQTHAALAVHRWCSWGAPGGCECQQGATQVWADGCRGGCRCPAVLGCGGCVNDSTAAGACCWGVAVSCLSSLFLLVTLPWSVAPCVLLLVSRLQANVVGAGHICPNSWWCSLPSQGLLCHP